MSARLLYGLDALEGLKQIPAASVHTCVTSPPYWRLRDYKATGQIGMEKTPEEFVARLVEIFRELRRVLRDDGTFWLNIGDTYAKRGLPSGIKRKDLIGVPWMLAFALRADGWFLRSEGIWAKKNMKPESMKDRPQRSHENIFLLTKSSHYFYDHVAVKEDQSVNERNRRLREQKQGLNTFFKIARDADKSINPSGATGALRSARRRQELAQTGKRNLRSVWNLSTIPYKKAHFATFPPRLAELCILAGTSAGGCCAVCHAPKIRTKTDWQFSCKCENGGRTVPAVVLDPFAGSGTAGEVALKLGRDFILIDIQSEYEPMANERIGLYAIP